ncbi:MAG: hypothetical protein ICV66_02120, partial [Chitinophagaceae bacterium]|nr:hypothetical protein [Chitinophagaceae bacterium]
VGLRKLFTDYLDDVSTTYVDPNDLLAEKGQKAVDLSYRGDEVPGEFTNTGIVYPDSGYPTKDAQRGNPKAKDYYYFSGIHVIFSFGGNSGGRTFAGKAGRKKYGCPSNPM